MHVPNEGKQCILNIYHPLQLLPESTFLPLNFIFSSVYFFYGSLSPFRAENMYLTIRSSIGIWTIKEHAIEES